MSKMALGCAGLLLSILMVRPVAAQVPASDVDRFDRILREAEQDYLLFSNPSMGLGERATLDYGAVASFNFFAIDDVNQKTHILRQTDLRFFANLNIDGVHEFYGRIRYTYNDFNSGDSFDGLGDEYIYPLGDRWWYRFDLGRAIETSEGVMPDWDADVIVGRQVVKWGSGIVLNEVLYSVLPSVEFCDFILTGLAGMTPSSTVIDYDSSRHDFDADTDRNFFGGMIAYDGLNHHRPYFYVIHQNDQNGTHNDPIITNGFIFPTEFRYNSTYFAWGSTGDVMPNLTYEAEFIYEIGQGLSTTAVNASSSATPSPVPAAASQSTEDIEAWAAKGELNYHLRDPNKTQFDFETVLASGDDDREFHTSNTFGGNTSGTHDTAFNAFGYANTGWAFTSTVSNLMMFRLGFSTYPNVGPKNQRPLRLGMDLYIFNKLDADAPYDEPTHDAHYMGMETDIYAIWRVTSDVSLSLRYGIFFPGEAIAVDHDHRHFLFTGLSYSF